MKLYLVRHADYAVSISKEDKLTEKGISDMTRMAKFLNPLNIYVSHIFHSGKSRAKQTAEILSHGFHCDLPPEFREGLNPNDDVPLFMHDLSYEEGDFLLVGHLPFMAKLVSHLLTKDENEIVTFYPGSVVCLEQRDRRWSIKWILTPGLLEKANLDVVY